MSVLLPITFVRPIVDESGQLTQEARVYFSDLANRTPSNGSGSPEGVVSAQSGATYYDLDAAPGSRHYIKLVDGVSGDSSLGWELA